MDVNELLSYKPVEGAAAQKNDNAKRYTEVIEPATKKFKGNTNEISDYDVLQYVESLETDGSDQIDEGHIKKMILIYEKRVLKNREMRIKFVDTAEKFMESELELFESIQELSGLTSSVEFFPIFVELRAFHSFLELLSHENTDIAGSVTTLIQEMLDAVSDATDHDELQDSMVDILIQNQILPLLIQNMERFNEQIKDEIEAVHNSLAIFENLFEIRPELVNESIVQERLLKWLLKRLRLKSNTLNDINKLYTSEILSIILQSSQQNRLMLGQQNGIDILLQQIAYYKRHNPTTADEMELMQNLFDSLCCCLLEKSNGDLFLKGEGLQLMNLLLREKKLSRNGSLKVLDYALSGSNGVDNCNKFVEILGLRTLFPLFMKTPGKGRKKMMSLDEYEEHVVSCISSLLRNCNESQKERVILKFVENDYEKVDRLMEFHFKYCEKLKQSVQGDTDLDSANGYLMRLDKGLFTLQMTDLILAEVYCSKEAIRKRIMKILSLRNESLVSAVEVLQDYLSNFGDSNSHDDWIRNEKVRIQNLILKFSN